MRLIAWLKGLLGWREPGDDVRVDRTDGGLSTGLFACSECDTIYISDGMQSCPECGRAVDRVPSERELDLDFGGRFDRND